VTVFDPDRAILRQRAKRIKRFSAELRALAEDMVETMHEAYGVGLAGPQIGLPIRIFVAEIPEEENNPQSGKTYVLVNPKIIKAGREQVLGEEGCLSIPGIYGDVWRSEEVVVRAQDVNGKEIRVRARGFLARVFQHEIDHLDGILFIDRVEEPGNLRRYVEKEGELISQPATLPLELFRPLSEPVRS